MAPRKRSGSNTEAAPAQSKKSKKSKTDDQSDDPVFAGILHQSKRWAPVSGSRNCDAEYKYLIAKQGEEKAYSYICVCRPPWEDDSNDSDESDDEDSASEDDDDDDDKSEEDGEDGEKSEKQPPCDGGKTCLCGKPAAEAPDHPWIITHAGLSKFNNTRTMTYLRSPGAFDMDVYNDFEGYGVMEVLENLILDFVEADGNWKEQWAVCEAMVWFLLDDAAQPMMGVEDGERADKTTELVGHIFLAMLALLASKKLLSETSEVKDLGIVMALYMQLPRDLRPYGILEGRDAKGDEPDMGHFDDHVLAYANKYGISLRGPEDIDEIAADCDGTAEVRVATAAEPDPWGVYQAIKKHEKKHGTSGGPGGGRKKSSIGGDQFDVTAWSSAERKAHSYNKKDPLGKKELLSLKMGMLPQPA